MLSGLSVIHLIGSEQLWIVIVTTAINVSWDLLCLLDPVVGRVTPRVKAGVRWVGCINAFAFVSCAFAMVGAPVEGRRGTGRPVRGGAPGFFVS